VGALFVAPFQLIALSISQEIGLIGVALALLGLILVINKTKGRIKQLFEDINYAINMGAFFSIIAIQLLYYALKYVRLI